MPHSHLAVGPGSLPARLALLGVLSHCMLASIVHTFLYSPVSRGLCVALCHRGKLSLLEMD